MRLTAEQKEDLKFELLKSGSPFFEVVECFEATLKRIKELEARIKSLEETRATKKTLRVVNDGSS